jgi:formylglycine-generating enzyme required for sulfatase activity
VKLSAGEDKNIRIRLKPAPVKQAAVSRKAGHKLINNLGMEFVYIPPGRFMMGSPSGEPGRDDDERQHRVTLTKGFYMQTTEVTQGQWKRLMGNNPSRFKNCGNDCPVERVSWDDCREFIRKLNRMAGGHKYRLPTEAEWEYAARAGSTTAFAHGGIMTTGCRLDPNLDAMGWYCGNSEKRTHAVAQKKPNAWGLYDMHGNVWEWCRDWYGAYPSGSVTDPKGPSSGAVRVDRGGGWGSVARYCRSADRGKGTPGHGFYYLGFRLVREP